MECPEKLIEFIACVELEISFFLILSLFALLKNICLVLSRRLNRNGHCFNLKA